MRTAKYTNPALVTALFALIFLAAGVIASLITKNFILLYISLGLIIASITWGVFVIIEAVQEKRDDSPISIKVPDAENTIVLQVILHGNSSLKVEPGLTIEVKKPEERDAPETKVDEE